MNELLVTWAGYAGIAVCVLALAYMIPFTSTPTEWIIKGIGFILLELLKHKMSFLIWFFKTISADHSRVFQHAFQSEEDIDPTQKIKRKAKGYAD